MLDLPLMKTPRKAPEKVYLRFGLWSARSRNYATGMLEEGVSVYPAKLIAGVVCLDVDLSMLEIMDECKRYLAGRLVFPVTGEEVAKGSDGEPVLRKVKPLAYAICIQAGNFKKMLDRGE